MIVQTIGALAIGGIIAAFCLVTGWHLIKGVRQFVNYLNRNRSPYMPDQREASSQPHQRKRIEVPSWLPKK